MMLRDQVCAGIAPFLLVKQEDYEGNTQVKTIKKTAQSRLLMSLSFWQAMWVWGRPSYYSRAKDLW